MTDEQPPPRYGTTATGVEKQIWNALYTIEDPELPISIVDLGIIYNVNYDETTQNATIKFTITYSGCPARDLIKSNIKRKTLEVNPVQDVTVDLVYSPPWNPEMISDNGRQNLKDHGITI